VVLLLLCHCAEIATPQGGPRDTEPPQLLRAEPPSGSTNIEPRQLVLEFDEYIQLKDAFSEVLLSPPMSSDPKLTVKGKKLLVVFPDSFLTDKTYTLNFGEALRDQRESNILKNFQYVFATGNQIDSLSLEVTVRDALSLEPQENMLVMLFPGQDPSLVRRERPYYFSRTDKAGRCTLNYLQPGSYQLLALQDQNFNYRYDLPNEKVAFLNQPVRIDTSSPGQNLLASTSNAGAGQLNRLRALRYGKVEATFSGPADTTSLSTQPSQGILPIWSRQRDTLTLFIADLNLDSLRVLQQLDTASIEKSVVLRKANPDSLRLSNYLGLSSPLPLPLPSKGQQVQTPVPTMPLELGREFVLQLNNPGELWDSSKLLVLRPEQGDTLIPALSWKDAGRTSLHIAFPLEEKTRYLVLLRQGFLRDQYGLINDTARYDFMTRALSDYGELQLQLQSTDIPLLIQLLDNSGRVLQQRFLPAGQTDRISWAYLKPGAYRLRAVADANENQQWDSSDYDLLRQPESVVYFSETISLRADWKLEYAWSPDFSQNTDNQQLK
jgi:uncharacterized protein (DUF2141 family)